MKVTRERKIYAAVIGLALLGLTLDRIIHPGDSGQDTLSDTSASLGTIQINRDSKGDTGVAPIAEELSLATRLTNAAEGSNAGVLARRDDPFSHSVLWLIPSVSESAGPSSADQFVQRHTLSAVMAPRAGSAGYAIIDGLCVRIGNSLDGFRLIAVDRASATLESGAGQGLALVPTRVKLSLKTSLVSG